jgi:hypothetical protein
MSIHNPNAKNMTNREGIAINPGDFDGRTHVIRYGCCGQGHGNAPVSGGGSSLGPFWGPTYDREAHEKIRNTKF